MSCGGLESRYNESGLHKQIKTVQINTNKQIRDLEMVPGRPVGSAVGCHPFHLVGAHAALALIKSLRNTVWKNKQGTEEADNGQINVTYHMRGRTDYHINKSHFDDTLSCFARRSYLFSVVFCCLC